MSHSNAPVYHDPTGPFRAEQIREGSQYELSNGHPIRCMSAGGSHARTTVLGGSMLDSDPLVTGAGADVGLSPVATMLRAPDVAVGIPDVPGWVAAVPPLCIEIADVGQDEKELRAKIGEYLEHGAKYVWVVRKTGPRRVEVHQPDAKMRTYHPGEVLEAPLALKNSVPVLAWFERDEAHEVTLRNLLQRKGYESLDAVRESAQREGHKEGHREGQQEGLAEGLRLAIADLCEVLGIALEAEQRAQLLALDVEGLTVLRTRLKAQRRWA